MNKQGDLTATRREYIANGLNKSDLQNDPVAQFAEWMDETLQVMPDDATSMTLATANAQGMPSARIVLLKHFDQQGFAWYTDFRSQKGDDLAENPQAEILFYWYPFERQVRIQGKVVKLSPEQGKKYFNQRPVGSRISAAVSHQSHPVDNRDVLENAVQQMEQAHPEGDIPHPDYWGGYMLIPSRFEFWQGRENRLHDRFQYNLVDGEWVVQRLQP
ncbi:MAG: pyridoxamine 5'-phosphate oxidase [Neptuniibacter sp.]